MVFKLFKKNKLKTEKDKEGKKNSESAVKVGTEESVKERAKSVVATAGVDYAYRLIKAPHVSEKAGNISAYGQYVFRVFSNANKAEIKKAVKRLYNVEVERVNIINIPSKKRTVGRYKGKKKGYKKAVVILKEGYTIETAPK